LDNPDNPVTPSAPDLGVMNLDEITRLARDADLAAQAEPASPRKKRAKKDSQGDPETPAPVAPIAYDPEFETMIVFAVGGGVDALKEKLDWTEPGMHWREKVGQCFSRLVQRIQPMTPGPMADVVTLLGYIAVWSVPNVAIGNATGTDSVGNHGVGENVEDAGVVGSGAPLLPLRHDGRSKI